MIESEQFQYGGQGKYCAQWNNSCLLFSKNIVENRLLSVQFLYYKIYSGEKFWVQ